MKAASNSVMEHIVLLANLAATLFMTGVIWFVQVVHYPLFAYYRDEAFRFHTQRTTLVVAFPMLVEALTALLLLYLRPQETILWTAAALVLLIWLSTNFLQLQQHAALEQGFRRHTYLDLVRSNWLRTAAWSMRSAMMLWVANG